MVRIIFNVFANIILFAGLRALSILIFFLLGIGASSSSEKYAPYILIPALVLHLAVIWTIYKRNKYIKSFLEFVMLVLIVVILFYLGHNNMISF